ncbi:MAG: Phytochrome-like protein cph2, partial [Conexibacter sp.]|nr:Phytochrome-like protein cph2 [Conexibacter sp.]
MEGGAAEALFECRFMGGVGRPVHLQRVARPMPESDLWWAAGRDTSEFHQLLAEQVDLRARLDGALPR